MKRFYFTGIVASLLFVSCQEKVEEVTKEPESMVEDQVITYEEYSGTEPTNTRGN